jgi:hypothetical protein
MHARIPFAFADEIFRLSPRTSCLDPVVCMPAQLLGVAHHTFAVATWHRYEIRQTLQGGPFLAPARQL